jgi:hypothetical protein
MWFEMPTQGPAGSPQAAAHAATPAPAPAPKAKPALSAEKFATELPKWRAMIAKGMKPDQIIAMQDSKHALTDEQKAQIRGDNANPAG